MAHLQQFGAKAAVATAQQKMLPRYLHISLLADKPIGDSQDYRYFSFYIDIRQEKATLGGKGSWRGDKTVIVKKLPSFISNMAVPGVFVQEVGTIEYRTNGQKACVIFYYPKLDMQNYPAEYANATEGLGYYVELLTNHYMEKIGAKLVYSPNGETSGPRTNQLKTVNLPVGWEVDIRHWEKGLACGVRRKIEKFFHNQEPMLEAA